MILMNSKGKDFKVGTRDYEAIIAHSLETAKFWYITKCVQAETSMFLSMHAGVNNKKKKEKKPMMIVLKSLTLIQLCVFEWYNTMYILEVKKA